MKKIALIEDRFPRQLGFLEQNNIDLDDYKDLLENFIEEKASNLLENILNDNFDLEKFDIIMCHKSVEYDSKNNEIISRLRDHCKTKHKILILFSGGISVNYYDNSEFELLELNSKTFYSQNLVLFLEAVKVETEDIMMLCYGENWKQNIVANILEKTNYLMEQVEQSIVYDDDFAYIDIEKLSKIDYSFYNPKFDNNQTTKDEVEKLRDSLLDYFHKSQSSLQALRTLKIHNDNIVDVEFGNDIKFESSDDIDVNISKMIKQELLLKEFDTIFIKDNLSSNYLELYGLRVAYHIRLSTELESKRFTPIVIVSDFDSETLNKFTKEAKILFTEGIYFCKNTKEDIQKYQGLELKGVSDFDAFLSSIEVLPSKDTSGSHGIANKWSIYRWAKFLGAKGEAIDKNKNEVENDLYFKYARALHAEQDIEPKNIKKPTREGKVLLIDDEWNKGWADILKSALAIENLGFSAFEYNFQDKSNFNLIVQLNHKELKEQVAQSDIVILDLRLIETDHENEDIDNYSGIKILQKIHEINEGIQVIMLTATSKSTILEKLYQKKILGYIKKEHPEDKNIDTAENINKFVELIDAGLERKYLKSIWDLQQKIKEIMSNDIFSQYGINIENYEKYFNMLRKENIFIFDILESASVNKFAYAALSMARFLEAILSIFIKENEKTFWDGESCKETTVYKKFHALIEKLEDEAKAKKIIDSELNSLIFKRNKYLHANKTIEFKQNEIIEWYKKLYEIISIIQNPVNLRLYDKNNVIKNLKDGFNNR